MAIPTLVSSRIPPLPTVQELIRVYKLGAKKHLSQNFLLNKKAIGKLVACAGNIEGGYVCEVGPGPGSITRQILQARVHQLSVIEKDERFFPILRGLAAAHSLNQEKFRLFHGDVLKFKMRDLFPNSAKVQWEDPPPGIHIIGNLPFNVSTPLIIKWLADIAQRQDAWSFGRTKLTLTFQKEVAERMTAPVSHKQRSRLSIMCQYLCDVRLKHIIPGKLFEPVPQVDAAVVHFVPLIEAKIKQPFPIVEKVVRHTFHYRQKYCRRGIMTLFPPSLQALADEMLKRAEVDPITRPQQLSITDFSELCNVYSVYCDKHPGLFQYYYRSSEPLSDDLRNGCTVDPIADE